MEVIFLITQFMERCREQKKDMHMVFIDLEKAYDNVTRNDMCGLCRSTKFQQSTLPSLRICTIIL
jgi:hypothetical protein